MTLETDRLFLREFTSDDWPHVLAYQVDPLYLRYSNSAPPTEADAQEFVQMFLDWQQEQPRARFQLAMVLKANNRLIGNCGVRVNDPDLREANIGYELNHRHWNQGYATEAARAILAFGFDELKMHRIWSWCVADNLGSVRVLEKIGMRLEGRLREKELIRGRWYDHLLYSILDHEWPRTNGEGHS
jgi:ribosomal-protein-alanine N-acetyltransferase